MPRHKKIASKPLLGGHLSVSQDGLFFSIFKTVKKQSPHSRSEKTGDEKGASALVSVFKLEKSGSLRLHFPQTVAK